MGAAINYFDFEKRCKLYDDTKRTTLPNEYVWGNSPFKIGNTYHSYFESWINTDGIDGYAYYCKIYHGTSSNMLGPYTGLTELTELKGQAWTAGSVCNPIHIIIGDRIYLYWTGTFWTGGITYPLVGTPARNNQRIGVAYTSINTPGGPFTLYENNPLLPPRPGEWDELLTNNPFPYIAMDGSLKMVYKSCTIAAPTTLKIGIAEATNPFTWTHAAAPIAGIDNVEESGVWREGEFMYLLTKGQDSSIVPAGNGILLYSKTGNPGDWHIVTDQTRGWRLTTCTTVLTSALRGRMERPYVYVENGKAAAFFLVVLSSDGLTSFNHGREIKQ